MKFFAILALVTLAIFGQTDAKSLQERDDVVWFPNDEGTLIPAILTPGNSNMQAGDISEAHFLLYTKANPTTPEEITIDLESITNSNFVSGAPLKFLVHGFGASFTGFPASLAKEYLKMDGEINIIALDWETLSEGPDYFLAFLNAQLVSQHSADLLNLLIAEGLASSDQIHLVGYSLGGQVVGQIGSRVSLVSPTIARITALDPALPLFDHTELENRTDPTDAEFVDVIHTAANGLLGFRDPCGHVDWYPNGGGYQPGCGIDISGSCAHGRAPATFIESVFSTTGFHGRECLTYDDFLDGSCGPDANVAIMGEHTPKETRGTFYLKTNAESPYAIENE